MLSTPPTGCGLFVEPLEQRIAPANLVALANHPQDAGASNYVTYATPPSAGKLGFVPASNYGVNGPANLYALALNGDGGTAVNNAGLTVPSGDQLQIFSTTDGYRTFLQAVNGNLVAFFLDSNNDGQVQNTELVGVSVGKKSVVNINGNVNGDIVANLAKDGSLMLSSTGKFKQTIAGLNVSGNVFGSIAAAGDISNVSVSGNVNAILAGTSSNGLAYHFSGPGVTTGTLAFPGLPDTQVGASLINVSVFSITDRLQSGDGGVGAKGGNITQLVVQGDSDGFTLLSGNGGNAGENLRGGAGGDIANVLVRGVPDATPNNQILIQAGHGGDNVVFKAGAGGSINGVATSAVSYDPSTNTGLVSNDLLADNITLHAGDGGNGLRAGKGGSITSALLYASIINDGVRNADGSANAEIKVLAGNGGINSAISDGAKAGNGGLISQVDVENLNITAAAAASSILVHGGNGGAAQGGGKGALGGDISSITLLGTMMSVLAGDGSDGNAVGGGGGNLSGVTVLATANIFASNVELDAGIGGSASSGIGGAGGSISTVRVNDSHIAGFAINSGTHANGGVGGGGAGGGGGSITDVQINDSGDFLAAAAPVVVRSGRGGDGAIGAGAGGNIDTFQLLGSDLSFNATAGNGGNVLPGGAGRGGSGGSFTSVGISNQPFDTTTQQFATGATGMLIAGSGGSGQGKGGLGGNLTGVNLRITSNITVMAGVGGASAGRRAGDGGSIASSAGNTLFGFVTAVAGNAGAVGTNSGAGGAIDSFIAGAATDITLVAGNGSVGGAGGSITASGITFNLQTSAPQAGSLIVTAGNGSVGNGKAGVGGSITGFSGFVGSAGITAFTAGNGGGNAGSDVSAAGGSIDQIQLSGSGETGVAPMTITFDAGNAGVAGLGKSGAAGGSVTNVTVYNLSSTSLVHHIAAGDGGGALKHGGAGGSIGNINIGLTGETNADIGIRSGRAYGYQIATGAGGLFAGLGGAGAKSGGAAGDVTNVTANAIASIAAGKSASVGLANTVDGIFLHGLTATQANANGSFSNFTTANLVGSVQNPNIAGATTYRSGDGLIAAYNITDNRDVRPEAELTVINGTLVYVDNRQPAMDPVVYPA